MTTLGDLERLHRLERIVTAARAGGHTDLLAKALHLLCQIIPDPPEGDVRPDRTGPHDARARARARDEIPPEERQLDGLHKLRRGRDQCSATRRDGCQCQAPAVKYHYVCRRHGGAAPQVRIKAEYTENLMRRHIAYTEWQAARGTAAESDALATFAETERAVEAYQIKIRLLRQIKAGLRPRNQVSQPDTGN